MAERSSTSRRPAAAGWWWAVPVVLIGWAVLAGVWSVAGWFATPEATTTSFYTENIAVVGVSDAAIPSATDAAVLAVGPTQSGAVLTGGGCAAAGWATLSAGRPVDVPCEPTVTDLGVVTDWREYQAAAQRSGGELGTLAGSGAECLAAVGPLAALGAARADGTTADYRTLADFEAADYAGYCPVTLIDPGDRAEPVIAALTAREDWTVIVVGIGGGIDGGDDAQLIYRQATTLPGRFTSDSTGRDGVVTLADLSRTLQGLISGSAPSAGPSGHPLQVDEGTGYDATALGDHVHRTQTLVTPPTVPVIVIAAVMAAIMIGAGIAWRLGYPAGRELLVVGLATVPVGLYAAGVLAWWRTGDPPVSLVVSVLTAWVALTLVCRAGWLRLTRRGSVTTTTAVGVVAAVGTAVAVIDTALGGVAQRSSLLALRPMRSFEALDGPAWALLVVSGVTVVAALALRGPRIGDTDTDDDTHDDDTHDDEGSPRPRLAPPARLILAGGVLVAVVVAAVVGWPDATGVPGWQQLIGGIAVAGWLSATGWVLARTSVRGVDGR